MRSSTSRRQFLSGASITLLGAVVCPVIGAHDSAEAVVPASETITPYAFGAKGDGRADDTIALQRAVRASTAAGVVLDLDRGIYRVTSPLTGSGDIRIINSGGAVIEASTKLTDGHSVFSFSGRAVAAGGLRLAARTGEDSLVLKSPMTWGPGDLGIIFDPADYSFSGFRSYYRAGELFEVETGNSTEVELRNPLRDSYDPRRVRLSRVEPVTGFLQDIIIRSRGGPEALIAIDYGRDFTILRPRLAAANNRAIAITRALRCEVVDAEIVNLGAGTDDYGIVFGNSQQCRVNGGNIFSRRHAVAIGGADYENSIPCRDVAADGASLQNDPSSGVHCADLHGNTESCGYQNCTISGGFSPQGRSSYLRGSIVHAMQMGAGVYAAEVLGGEHVIEGNTFYFKSDPSEASRGAIDFGGNSDAITEKTINDTNIIVSKNTFVSADFGGNTMLLLVRNAGTRRAINVRFSDNDLRVNTFASTVRLRLAKGRAKSDFVIIERNAKSERGMRDLYPDSDYSDLLARSLETPSS